MTLESRKRDHDNGMTANHTNPALDALGDLRGFTFDLDGTIWEGPRLLPGASELVADLRQEGLGVVFASNCSRHGSPLLCQKLASLGIATTPLEVFTPVDLVGEEVKHRLGNVPVLVIGNDEVGRIMEASGHTRVAVDRWHEAKAVVVGIDHDFTYDRLRGRPPRAVAAGAAFFAINRDARFPVGPGAYRPRLRCTCRGDRRCRRSATGDHRQTRAPAVSKRHRPAWLSPPPGGHGRR